MAISGGDGSRSPRTVCLMAVLAVGLVRGAVAGALRPGDSLGAASCGGPACGDDSIPGSLGHAMVCDIDKDTDPSEIRLFPRARSAVGATATGLSAGPGTGGGVALALARVGRSSAYLVAVDVDQTVATGQGQGCSPADVMAWAPVEVVTPADVGGGEVMCYSTPLAAGNGYFYAVCGALGNSDATVHAFQGSVNGSHPTARWHVKGAFSQQVEWQQQGARMVLEGDLLLVPATSGVTALSTVDGSVVWSHTSDGAGTPLVVSIDGKKYVIVVDAAPSTVTKSFTVSAVPLDSTDGVAAWTVEQQYEGDVDVLGVDPIIVMSSSNTSEAGILIVYTYDDNFVWAFDLEQSGSLLWTFDTGNLPSLKGGVALRRAFGPFQHADTIVLSGNTVFENREEALVTFGLTWSGSKISSPHAPIVVPCGRVCRSRLIATSEGTLYGIGSEMMDSIMPADPDVYEGYGGYVYALNTLADGRVDYTDWTAKLEAGVPALDIGGVSLSLGARYVVAIGAGAVDPRSQEDVGVFVAIIGGNTGKPYYDPYAYRCRDANASDSVPATKELCDDNACPDSGERGVYCCYSWLQNCDVRDPFQASNNISNCLSKTMPAPSTSCGHKDDGSNTGPHQKSIDWHKYGVLAAGGFVLIGMLVAFLVHRRQMHKRALPVLSLADGDAGGDESLTYVRL